MPLTSVQPIAADVPAVPDRTRAQGDEACLPNDPAIEIIARHLGVGESPAKSQEAPRQVVPLTQLHVGARARVASRDLCCDDCELLNAMGLTDRCELRVCQSGSTCIVEVRSTRLGLSRAVAGRILVDASSVSSAKHTT